MTEPAHDGRRPWLLPVLCAFLLLVAWGGALDAPFVADDWSHLAQTLGEHGPQDVRDSLTGSWHDRGPPWFWRPLAVITFVVDGMLHGPHPTGFHVTQFALFLVTALLLAAATRLLLERFAVRADVARAAGAIAACLACVLPSQLEAIAWISNRDGPLANAFGLAALVLALRDRRALALIAAALALASKEIAVAWVGIVIASFALPPRRLPGLVRAWPFVVLLALYFAARRAMFGTFGTGQVALALVDRDRGVGALVANVLAWLRFEPWPVARDLLGPAALPLGVACAVLAAAPLVLAFARGSPVPRKTLVLVSCGAVAAAVVLLGPITLVVPSPDDLRHSRFVPQVALPLSAALGLAWAAALAGRFRPIARALLVLSIAVQAGVAALHAASFALVARDLESVRDIARGFLAERAIDPAQTSILFTILDPPRAGPAEFSLTNAFHGLLMRPITDVDVPIGALRSDELAVARLVPEIRTRFESGAILLPPGPPLSPSRPLERIADSLRRFERLGLGAPRFVDRARPPAAPAPTAPPFAALDVAALSIVPGDPRDPHAEITIEWTGSRGNGSLRARANGRPTIVPLETVPDWLAAGDVKSLRVRSTGVDRPATPLARLPEIAIVAPGAEFALGDDPHRRVDIDFTPPAKCAAYRVRVVPSLAGMLGDSFDAALLPLDASGVAHARFLDGAMNGRRTALDWRFVRASALATGAASVRWFIEGEDDVGQVVARSRLIEMRLAK